MSGHVTGPSVRSDLTLGELYSVIGHLNGGATLAAIAAVVHVRRSLVRHGLNALIAARAIEREESGDAPLYHQILNARFADASVRAPEKKNESDLITPDKPHPDVIRLHKVDGTERKVPLAIIQEDEPEIEALSRVLFHKAADAAAEIAVALAERATKRGTKLDAAAQRLFVARGLRIAACALIEANEIMEGRAVSAATKAVLP